MTASRPAIGALLRVAACVGIALTVAGCYKHEAKAPPPTIATDIRSR